MQSLSQRTRLIILVLYALLLSGTSKLALNSWVPPLTHRGLWFYSGLAAIILGSLLETPFYTSPKEAISNAVAAVVAIVAINVWDPQIYSPVDQALWLMVIAYSGIVLGASLLAIILKDSSAAILGAIAQSMSLVSESIGNPKLTFSTVYWFALVAFHRTDPSRFLPIAGAWAIVVGFQPLELGAYLIGRWREILAGVPRVAECGEVVAHKSPGIVLVRQAEDAKLALGDALIVRAEDGRPGLAMVLDRVGFAEGCWLRALHLETPRRGQLGLAQLASAAASTDSVVRRCEVDNWQNVLAKNTVWAERQRLIGLVAPGTSTSRLRMEIVRTDIDLTEGRLVEVSIGSASVLYQIIDGLTKEEILQQKNTRGYVSADAKKIGTWDDESARFEPVEWVPSPNAPVFIAETTQVGPTRGAIGHFPGTSYPVELEDINSLVTHNAAILGILGVGKTFLALELVERMIAFGMKVICLDLTNQYAEHLFPFYDAETRASWIADLQKVGPPGKTNVQKNVEEGGSVTRFRDKLDEVMREFLDSETSDKIAIFNPIKFEVWRQDSKPYEGRASMVSLTPPHITRLVTETTLQVLQKQGMTDVARCCIVFEEAHSLIPEWGSVVAEGDKSATNGTARAILQGRKFGLGCLVVTQRTANVTKSILTRTSRNQEGLGFVAGSDSALYLLNSSSCEEVSDDSPTSV